MKQNILDPQQQVTAIYDQEDSYWLVRRQKWRNKNQREWLKYCADNATISDKYYNMPE